MAQKTIIYTPSISYNGKTLQFNDVPLTVTTKNNYKCKNCGNKITYDLIKKVVPTAEESFVEALLVYLNKYREAYKLDTCLRKAHFIAQVGAEMSFEKANLKEANNISYSSRSGAISSHCLSRNALIDSTMLKSLKSQILNIFKLTDKDNKEIRKTAEELIIIIKAEKIYTDIRKLYAKFNGVTKGKTKVDEVLKIVKHKVKDKTGKEIEEVKYNIILKKT